MGNIAINKPTLSPVAKERLRTLALRDDSQIDLSDCPKVTDWRGAVSGAFKFYKSDDNQKQQVATEFVCHLD